MYLVYCKHIKLKVKDSVPPMKRILKRSFLVGNIYFMIMHLWMKSQGIEFM